ncbi:hypothetical protein [Alcanivorax sp. 1008]|uniref:hypothetical protein n=1 Tax=Alcanivorax sp. 1008 TaxID=2816853 RepID=UPI001DB08EF4|nr:hypothetical protein [Alcanivorax sp. 1008]MCC1498053.1 hypothetical protein [Alcanivorax sp. 1008]
MDFSLLFKRLPVLLAVAVVSSPAYAMVAMEEEEMSDVSGAGIAIALDDFSFSMAPTSYIELTGTATALPQWRRGDARYYGLTLSGGQTGAATGLTFARTGACNQNVSISCPIGAQGSKNFAPVYDPYVLRAFEYDGYNFQGTFLTGANRPTVLELIGPSNMDNWRWSFWGEIEVDRGGANQALLQSQTIINGRNATVDGKPTILRIFRTQDTPAASTLGIAYQSALSGDFRFSVAQTAASPNAREMVPFFNQNEGVRFGNVDAFLPIGRLHSQAITLDTSGTSGNFEVRLTPIPNIASVYNDIYCGAATCATTTVTGLDTTNSLQAITSPNAQTRGYIRWGDFSNPANYTAATNGIRFVSPSNVSTHIGVARLEGVLIQSLTLTTQGAGP